MQSLLESMKRCLPAILAGMVILLGLTRAASGSKLADQGTDSHAEELKQTLDWLDHYLTVQVIFTQEDMIRLREEVAKMSPKQLDAWLKRTEKVRERLESPEWAKTQKFLRDFLSKQAVYSDQEIEQMRKEAAQMTPDQLMGLLDRIEEKFAEMTAMHRESDQRRQFQVEGRELQAARQRDAAQQREKDEFAARRQYLANQTVARAHTSGSQSSRPLFGTTQSKAAAQSARSQYRPPGPLIDSRDAARIAVEREVFGGYGWGW